MWSTRKWAAPAQGVIVSSWANSSTSCRHPPSSAPLGSAVVAMGWVPEQWQWRGGRHEHPRAAPQGPGVSPGPAHTTRGQRSSRWPCHRVHSSKLCFEFHSQCTKMFILMCGYKNEVTQIVQGSTVINAQHPACHCTAGRSAGSAESWWLLWLHWNYWPSLRLLNNKTSLTKWYFHPAFIRSENPDCLSSRASRNSLTSITLGLKIESVQKKDESKANS